MADVHRKSGEAQPKGLRVPCPRTGPHDEPSASHTPYLGFLGEEGWEVLLGALVW
jgi:hypothetical protein